MAKAYSFAEECMKYPGDGPTRVYGPALDEDEPTTPESIAARVFGAYGGQFTMSALQAFASEVAAWHNLPGSDVIEDFGLIEIWLPNLSEEDATIVHAAIARREPASIRGLLITTNAAQVRDAAEMRETLAAAEAHNYPMRPRPKRQTVNRVPAVQGEAWVATMGKRDLVRTAAQYTAAPRPGQTWRSPTGEEGRIYDTTPDGNYRPLWHLRMTSGLRVREEHADLVTAWTYVSGPTEPETNREAKDRVGALMIDDRPEGVTERTWQAVVMAMGEGEDESGMRQKCAAARVALALAERMRVMR